MSRNNFLKPKVYVNVQVPSPGPVPKLPDFPIMDDHVKMRAFWDPQFQREFLGRFPGVPAVTKDEFDSMVDHGFDARRLMDRVPAGVGVESIMDILLNELREARREIRVLQDDKIDKILLEDDNGS